MSETDYKLKYRCSRKWEDLIVTEKANVRHCNECKEDVRQIKNQNEFNEYAKNSTCVSVRDSEVEYMGEPEYSPSEVILYFPEQEIAGDKAELIRTLLHKNLSIDEVELMYHCQEVSVPMGTDSNLANDIRKKMKRYYIDSKVRPL